MRPVKSYVSGSLLSETQVSTGKFGRKTGANGVGSLKKPLVHFFGGICKEPLYMPSATPVNMYAMIASVNFIVKIKGCPADGYTSLEGYDDWRNLAFDFRTSNDFADSADRVTAYPEERTWDDILKGVESFDFDGDGYFNALDTCVTLPNPDQTDTDGDGWGDECDNCPTVPNSDENGINADLVGAACKEQGGKIYLPLIVTS